MIWQPLYPSNPPLFNRKKVPPYPLGATPDAVGVNFSLFSENATGVELLLFERDDDLAPFQTFQFDPYE
jgi:isoamylase